MKEIEKRILKILYLVWIVRKDSAVYVLIADLCTVYRGISCIWIWSS